jgi:hypothetical protein
MSATVLPFTGMQRSSIQPSPQTPASPKAFMPGEPVIIADYEWDLGDVEIRATVVSQQDDWVRVRIPDVGSYRAHVSVVHAIEPEAA